MGTVLFAVPVVLLGWGLALAGLVGCAMPWERKPPLPGRVLMVPHTPLGPPAEAVLIRSLRGKPPLLNLTVEVALSNYWLEPRWFLIPRHLPLTPGPPSGGVSSMEVYAIESPAGFVCLVAYLHGNEGAYALLLPPRGKVRLKGLEIGYWEGDEPAQSVELIVRAAREVSIGGKPLREWFGTNPVSDIRSGGDYAARVFVSRRGDARSKGTPLVLTDEEVLTVTVPLVPPAGEGK